jgi:hypothetical protein
VISGNYICSYATSKKSSLINSTRKLFYTFVPLVSICTFTYNIGLCVPAIIKDCRVALGAHVRPYLELFIKLTASTLPHHYNICNLILKQTSPNQIHMQHTNKSNKIKQIKQTHILSHFPPAKKSKKHKTD